MGFLLYIIIGIISGFVAGKIMRGGGFGILVNLVVGIIGGLLGIYSWGIIGSLITSVIGAIVFLWILSFFTPTSK